MNEKTKKVLALALGALVIGGTGVALGANAFPKVIEIDNPVIVPGPVQFVDKIVEKEVEKIVEVDKIIEVDNGDMAFVLERLEDKEVIADAEEIVKELKYEDKAIKGSFAFVEDNLDDLFDMLEDEGIVNDEDDVKVIKVYNDFEDVRIIESNFDDAEYQFGLKFKVEDTDEEVKKYVEVVVKYEDGDFELESVSEI
jgi:hypothetical protein